ncbi:hypothetical protein ASAP_0441 [Asaia bogorensis]|uniref:Uncharacterized protein n=1 Tax=Asaia bogorensis TaxID=91915 RepID=A0A060QGU5_9PROT|nr:hypothetical protein ASAP_0441 [Asaia bogorensis]
MASLPRHESRIRTAFRQNLHWMVAEAGYIMAAIEGERSTK